MLSKKQTEENHQDRDDEHEERDPVDAMHVAHEIAGRRVRIFFPDIKVFGYLSQYTHDECVKDI